MQDHGVRDVGDKQLVKGKHLLVCVWWGLGVGVWGLGSGGWGVWGDGQVEGLCCLDMAAPFLAPCLGGHAEGGAS